MAKVKKKLPWWVKVMRYFARTIVILWATFWGLFAWASMIGRGPPWWVILIFSSFTAVTLAGIVFLWIWELAGSIVLFAEGLIIFILLAFSMSDGTPGSSDILGFFILIAPLLVVGILSFLSWWFARKAPPKEE